MRVSGKDIFEVGADPKAAQGTDLSIADCHYRKDEPQGFDLEDSQKAATRLAFGGGGVADHSPDAKSCQAGDGAQAPQ